MSHQSHPDFYQQVEDFVLCAVADSASSDYASNTEIGLFLLSLLSRYKKEELAQSQQASLKG